MVKKEKESSVFGDWKFLGETRVGKHQKTEWLCECKCGNRKFVSANDVKRGKSKRCHTCGVIEANRKKLDYHPTKTMWGKIRRNAIARSLNLNITRKQAWELFKKQKGKCALSGLNICFSTSSVLNDGTASLDRIDSKKGYELGNVQWVHKHVNVMKMDLDQKTFVNLCHDIAETHPKTAKTELPNRSNDKYWNRRDLCECGNYKLKTSKKCALCFRKNC